MTDADLIYNALLRAERRLERKAAADTTLTGAYARLAFTIVEGIRQEVGAGLAARDATSAGQDAGKVD